MALENIAIIARTLTERCTRPKGSPTLFDCEYFNANIAEAQAYIKKSEPEHARLFIYRAQEEITRADSVYMNPAAYQAILQATTRTWIDALTPKH